MKRQESEKRRDRCDRIEGAVVGGGGSADCHERDRQQQKLGARYTQVRLQCGENSYSSPMQSPISRAVATTSDSRSRPNSAKATTLMTGAFGILTPIFPTIVLVQTLGEIVRMADVEGAISTSKHI